MQLRTGTTLVTPAVELSVLVYTTYLHDTNKHIKTPTLNKFRTQSDLFCVHFSTKQLVLTFKVV